MLLYQGWMRFDPAAARLPSQRTLRFQVSSCSSAGHEDDGDDGGRVQGRGQRGQSRSRSRSRSPRLSSSCWPPCPKASAEEPRSPGDLPSGGCRSDCRDCRDCRNRSSNGNRAGCPGDRETSEAIETQLYDELFGSALTADPAATPPAADAADGVAAVPEPVPGPPAAQRAADAAQETAATPEHATCLPSAQHAADAAQETAAAPEHAPCPPGAQRAADAAQETAAMPEHAPCPPSAQRAAGAAQETAGASSRGAGADAKVVTSLEEAFAWPADVFDQLERRYGIDALHHLKHKLEQFTHTTCFSGVDSPASALEIMKVSLSKRLGVPIANARTNLSAVEWNSEAQLELQLHPGGPQCVFENIEDFFVPEIKTLLAKARRTKTRVTYAMLAPAVKSGKAVQRYAYCGVHRRQCFHKEADGHWAGTPCVNFSTMGLQDAEDGSSIPAFLAWVGLRMLIQDLLPRHAHTHRQTQRQTQRWTQRQRQTQTQTQTQTHTHTRPLQPHLAPCQPFPLRLGSAMNDSMNDDEFI